MTNSDRIFSDFLRTQLEEGLALAQQSDIVDLIPLGDGERSPDRYIVRFHAKCLVRPSHGTVTESTRFDVGIWFPEHYLRQIDPLLIVTLLHPAHVWHPNVKTPAICLGHVVPGTSLVDLVFQSYEILTYQNWAAHDGLNPEACQWARNHQDRFPVDGRPLKRRALKIRTEPVARKEAL